MAKNVFISYRFVDGVKYKNELSKRFDSFYDTVDYSEDEDRSTMSDEYIRQYLYGKLRRSSVTIVLLTPQALNHRKNWYGQYNDWMYDECNECMLDKQKITKIVAGAIAGGLALSVAWVAYKISKGND